MSADLVNEPIRFPSQTAAAPPHSVPALEVPAGIDTVLVCMVDMQGRLVGSD